jgi:hypothetical protein
MHIMAKQIIGPKAEDSTSPAGDDYFAERASTIERARQHGVKVDTNCPWYDKCTGTAEALVAAGIITAAQLPGQSEGPRVSATYYRGALQVGGPRMPKDEHYKNIVRPPGGRRVKVICGLSAAERGRRRIADDASKAALREASRERQSLDSEKYRQYVQDLILRVWHATSSAARGICPSVEQPYRLVFESDRAESIRRLLVNALEHVQQATVVEHGSSPSVLRAKGDVAFQLFMTNQGLRGVIGGAA